LFVCPRCHSTLLPAGEESLHCPLEGLVFQREGGIWHFLPPERQAYYATFSREYEAVRRAEGRAGGSDFYRGLPDQDLSGLRVGDWRIRAASFRALLDGIVSPLEQRLERPLVVLDLGAGNGWLSNRLAQRGHALAAVDLICNDWDGLGAFIHYETSFEPVQAEFDALPFQDSGFDLAVFNASLHYSVSYETTLSETLRVLRPGGKLVVMDSPLYSDPESGRQMVAERERLFSLEFGFPSNALPSENYLTTDRVKSLETILGLHWQAHHPAYGFRWGLRHWKAKLLGRRQPAEFFLIAADKSYPASLEEFASPAALGV
jgi:SAM-dependent methyltransferase